ncbi:fibronectin type III domain-containing protein, partial [Ruminiclostridium cellobioparum]
MRRQKLRVLNAVLSAAIVLTTVFVPASAGAAQPEQGKYIVGDGSGGGGGGACGSNRAGGAGGNGGGGNDTITGTSGNDVIFGDGSGGGAGCRSIGSSINPRGGTGGGGDDIIFGGAGDDIIFGDGFNGQDYTGWYPGNGGLGGGGAGGSGGDFGQPPTGGFGGIGGGGGGAGGRGDCFPGATLIPGVGNPGSYQVEEYGGNGGESALANENSLPGQGGMANYYSGGGGAGFGGAAGGNAGYNLNGLGGADGDDNQYTYDDSTGSIFGYFTGTVLRSLLLNNPNFGGGNDVINGGAGYNNLFGMGGNNTFIVDSADNAVRTVIWDLKFGDKLLLENDGILVSEITTGSILDNAIYGDFDGDELDDDTRITFNGRPIDLIDVILSNTNNLGTGGEISPANSAPTVNLNDGIIACNFTSAHEPGFGYGFVNDRDGDKDWDGGTLEVQITSNANVNDRIGVYEETLLTPVLNISGTDVSSNGVTFGTIPPVISTGANTHLKYFVTGSSKYTVEFNNNATNELVRRFVNMLIFNTSASGDGNRIVTVKLTDKNGNSSIDTAVIGNTAVQAAPVLTGAYTDTSGRKVYATFDKDMMGNPAGRHKQFTVTVDNVDYSAIEVSNDNRGSTLELTLPFSISYGQSVKLSYTKGSIKALDTGALENFQLQEVVNNIPCTYTVPEAPLNVTATAGNGQVTVSFDAPFDGGSPITEYIVTTSPGGITTTGSAISITVDGLTNGVSYSFTVKAVNAAGEGPESSASNEVTPQVQDNGGGDNGGGNNGGGDNGGGD